MKLPPYIIGIHGVPRSGSSWLGQIFNSSPFVAYRFQPLFSYAFKDRINETSTLEEIDRFFLDILETNDNFVLQRAGKSIAQKNPQFRKSDTISHLVYKEVRYHHILTNLFRMKPNLRIIGLIRHPCAAINSWLRAPREFLKDWNPLDEWRHAPSKNQNKKEEYNGFEKWKEVAGMFLNFSKEYPDQFYLLKYSELNKAPIEVTRALFDFCSLRFDKQTILFIEESTKSNDNDPYGVYRGKSEDLKWQQELQPLIIYAILHEVKNTEYAQFMD